MSKTGNGGKPDQPAEGDTKKKPAKPDAPPNGGGGEGKSE